MCPSADDSVCSQQMNSISVFYLLLWTGVSSFKFEDLAQYVSTHEEDFIEVFLGWDVVVNSVETT